MAKRKKEEIQANDTSLIAERAAEIAYRKHRKPIIVEDTGLFIPSLKGFPGCFASYSFNTIGIEGLLKLLDGKERYAFFTTSVCYIDSSKKRVFKGVLEGRIAVKSAGSGGFGFDPIFVPRYYNRTLAELSLEEKSSISHRARALRMFARWYKKWATFISNKKG